MQLWKRFNELAITRYLRLGYGAVIQTTAANGTVSEMDLSELGAIEGVTAGTVTASKAVVVDANKDIASFRDLRAAGYIYGDVSTTQGAPTAKTVSATLTAAEVAAGIITVNQAAGATSAQQLPLASAMDTQFARFAAGDSFDFSVINTSTVDAEDASVTTNTGWTLVGSMDIHAYSAAGSLNSSALFRARKTGTAAWTLYRLS